MDSYVNLGRKFSFKSTISGKKPLNFQFHISITKLPSIANSNLEIHSSKCFSSTTCSADNPN